ncbi:hypothetical protein CgunFtcFv8_015901 [Champsocephalus gunnari]|uniref:Uncharacterized protein n=1 Tax=Champsocephalus gunnari TaxID=52237 RepID=A0AAN8C7J0_CHAGU|nr:hypothetical protein CgunFtcFv8_015901 [Champsocephalus gunnari]
MRARSERLGSRCRRTLVSGDVMPACVPHFALKAEAIERPLSRSQDSPPFRGAQPQKHEQSSVFAASGSECEIGRGP